MFKLIYGGDTETIEGKPLSLQFYSEDTNCNEIIFVDEHTAQKSFLEWCGERERNYLHVVYIHNLAFDLPELLYNPDIHRELCAPGGSFDFDVGDWHLHGVYGAPTFCRITHKWGKHRILLVDSMLWMKTSLDNAAKIVCPQLPKLKRPHGLGSKLFTSRDDSFCEYAMRDAEVAYHIGRAVETIHGEFDIAQSVSLADMSCKIFKHHYLNYTIPQPRESIIWAALQSYHGGKNNVIPDAVPRWHLNVSSLDLVSAYPFAMAELPSFENPKAYRRITFTGKRKPRSVPPLGVYRVSGRTTDCKWPVLFTHSFAPIRGGFSDIWMHGFEVNEALRSGELKISKIYGHIYDENMDHGVPALREFVNDFYQRKEQETDRVLRYMYKIILNSLYGKFIQTRKSMRSAYYEISPEDRTQVKASEYMELRAGGMFHPFIASSITAHTRAYIHRIEHEHQALHTATDGIFTQRNKIKRIDGYPKSGIGSLTVEARGDLVLLRNKCYILYSKSGKIKSQYFRGKQIDKFAKHGFQGTVFDLERLVAHNKRKYTVNKPNRLRQSLQRGLQVNEFVKRDMVLKVPPIIVK